MQSHHQAIRLEGLRRGMERILASRQPLQPRGERRLEALRAAWSGAAARPRRSQAIHGSRAEER
ncbi:MAG TPA: hypothetical protein PLG73_06965 [Candidatus Sumerlaeota bacterium]|nr:hypothetical protein [Candidatus Sumerlaeota bacterium]